MQLGASGAKYRDRTGPAAYDVLPRLDPSDIRYRWLVDFYDGPVTGLIRYQGRSYWFENPEERWAERSGTMFRGYSTPRRFLVVELSQDQLAKEEYWQAEFRRYVGGYGDFDDAGQPVGRRGMQPVERHHLYFDRYEQRAPMDLSDNTVIGWFEEGDPPQGASTG